MTAWLHDRYVPEALSTGIVANPRLCRIVSHHDEQSECFSVQFEVAGMDLLHKWYTATGAALAKEMEQAFQNNAVSFSTIMEVID